MANDNSRALARVDSVEPSTMAELKDFADMAARSRFFGAETKEQALILAMAGKDLGFSYTQALRAFYVVKGKPTLSADGMVAACIQHPAICEYFRPVRVTETEAVWETKPRGGEPIQYRFTMEDAQKAGLVNDMYRKHPKRMLSARCKAYLARDVYPQLLMGLVTDDEAEEIASSRPTQRVVATVVTHDEPAPVSPVAMLAERLEAATNLAELAQVAAAIKSANVSSEERDYLRAAYSDRQKALKTPPAPVVVEAEPMPEPGSEG